MLARARLVSIFLVKKPPQSSHGTDLRDSAAWESR